MVQRCLHSYQKQNASSQWSKWVHNILTTVMTRIIVDKSTDNATVSHIPFVKVTTGIFHGIPKESIALPVLILYHAIENRVIFCGMFLKYLFCSYQIAQRKYTHWLVTYCVSIHNTSCWPNDAWATTILHFDDQSKQVFFSFHCVVFLMKYKTCSLCFYRVKETLVKVWENSKKLWKHLLVVSCSHSTCSPKPSKTSCFYNWRETRNMYFVS